MLGLAFMVGPAIGAGVAVAANKRTALAAPALREPAPRLQIAMLCTVHQPSTSVFGGFDKVCFLTGGRVCYLGAAAELAGYLEAIGRPVPPNSNPADYMLDLTNRDFVEGATVDGMMQAWEERAAAVAAVEPAALEKHSSPASPAAQLRVLLEKHSLLVLRDPLIYLVRAPAFLIVSIFISLLYIEQRNPNQNQALARPRALPPSNPFLPPHLPTPL